MSGNTHRENATIRRQAIEWLAAISSDMATDDDRERFQLWLQHPEHYEAYQIVSANWGKLGNFAHSPALDETVRQAEIEQQTGKRLEDKRWWNWPTAAIAATFVIGIVLGLQWFLQPGSIHRTEVGEQKTVMLDDGSTIKLNTDTRLRVNFDSTGRRIYLLAGEANFAVTRDPRRPFTVHAGAGAVTAIGTNFDVRIRENADVVVTLIEGAVNVLQNTSIAGAPQQDLSSGQQIAYTAEGFSDIAAINIVEVTAWQKRKIIFQDLPLVQALSEVNRYTQHKIVVGDEALNDLRIGGMFDVGANDTLIEALQNYFSIRAVHHPDGKIVLWSGEN